MKYIRIVLLVFFALISSVIIAYESSTDRGLLDGLDYMLSLFPIMVCSYLIDSTLKDLTLSLSFKQKIIRILPSLPYMIGVIEIVFYTNFQEMLNGRDFNSFLFPLIISTFFFTGFYFLNNHQMIRKINLVLSIIGLVLLIPSVLLYYFQFS